MSETDDPIGAEPPRVVHDHPVSQVVVFRDARRQWRWHALSANYRVVADSGESYHDRDYALDVAQRIFPHVEVEVEEPSL